MKKVTVLGAGSWGTALAMVLSKNSENVVLWTKSEEQCDELNNKKTNEKYLKGISIPKNISGETNIENAVKDAELIVLGVPSQAIRSVCSQIKNYVKEGQILVNVAKGLEKQTGLRMSEVVLSELDNVQYAVLSGPSHAEEVALGLPTTIVVSSESEEVTSFVQDAFMTDVFRVYTNTDVIGVELGGTLKNIIAFGCGVTDGLGYGDNTKSALITRGLQEVKSIGVALGAKEDTFNGLSGVGDLIVTCTSKHSRNRQAGYLVGQGYSVDEAVEEVEMVVEGIVATEAVYKKTRGLNMEFPILESLYSIVFEGENPENALVKLMKRDKKSE